MNITLDKNDKYTVLRVHDEKLVTLIAPDLKSEFVKLNAEGIKNVIIDLTEVRYTDSSGLCNSCWQQIMQFSKRDFYFMQLAAKCKKADRHFSISQRA